MGGSDESEDVGEATGDDGTGTGVDGKDGVEEIEVGVGDVGMDVEDTGVGGAEVGVGDRTDVEAEIGVVPLPPASVVFTVVAFASMPVMAFASLPAFMGVPETRRLAAPIWPAREANNNILMSVWLP